MDLGLAGRTAFVGGSSRGLGFAIAEELAREGASVALNSRDAAAVEAATEAIRSSTGARVLAIQADTSTPDGVDVIVETVGREFGNIDILVTNTGGPPAGPFESHSAEAWRAAYASLLESVVGLSRAFLPGMKDRSWGRIINVTSIAVKQPVNDLILSNSIRSAVTGFARTLANEVAGHGITVNNVMPGYTRTDRVEHLAERVAETKNMPVADVLNVWNDEIPMGRIGEPPELAALVAFLASDRASYITAQSIAVDGGWIRSLL